VTVAYDTAKTPPVDVAVVGGGIVGLATAYRLLEARPDLSVTVLEREEAVGTGQSSRNSGVLHAGLYYPPGSAKARWCTAGKAQLERFCEEHGVPLRRSGKVVAAVRKDELPGLAALAERARANGVEVEELGPEQVLEHEPHLRALAGLWSPATAVTDFGAVCRALADQVETRGGEVRTGTPVLDIGDHEHHAGGGRRLPVRIVTGEGYVEARVAVVCAGLQADRFARLAGLELEERVVPFRGAWLRLRSDRAHLVNGNIYPVPTGGLPFLGVHLTRRIDGEVWIGPNAVLALAREGRGPWSPSGRDLRESLTFPGLYRLAAQHAGTAVGEVWRDRVLRATVREVQRYVPDIEVADVERGPWGVRAQLLGRDGRLVDDFQLRRSGQVLHVLNAPSPAATASLAIGAELRDQAVGLL
jgi:(S)-2-hydroxyglutarate dehydrogenase